MDIETLALGLQETKDRSLRNEGRIKKLETEHETLHSLATSVAVMAEQMKSMNTKVGVLTDKVDELEAKPAKRWETVVTAILTGIAGALLGAVLVGLGLG